MKQEWAHVPGTNIQVSNLARFRQVVEINKRVYYRAFQPKLSKKPSGYLRVFLDKTYVLHTLIATLFVPNPDSKTEVNHKDGDKDNNSAANLEWVTRSENMRHSFHVLDTNTQLKKRRVKIFKNSKLFAIAPSVNEAARMTKGHSSRVSSICQGKRKSSNEFSYAYAE